MLLAKGQKILIVDDERRTADTLATIFTIAGYEARATYSAEEALEILADWPPALIILDVVLPKMSGIDLAIAQAGHPFDILEKPVHPDLMLQKVSRLLSVN